MQLMIIDHSAFLLSKEFKMKLVFGVIFVAFVAAITVSSSSTEEIDDISRIMAAMQEKQRFGAQIDDIGPNFNQQQFFVMLDRDLKAALQRKCKKLGGDKVYAKSIEAEEQAKVCIENWLQSAEISKTFDNFKLTGDFKPVMKKICTKRYFIGLFGCIDTYFDEVSGCYFPNEMEILRKVNRIVKNMVDLVCSNDGDDFALFNDNGEAQRCVDSSEDEIKTCANQAIYLVVKRFLEKSIENEHFELEMEPEDCKAFDAAKSCFVSSVDKCTSPSVENIISSAFQIVRNETQCGNDLPGSAHVNWYGFVSHLTH